MKAGLGGVQRVFNQGVLSEGRQVARVRPRTGGGTQDLLVEW